jgi:hypothetical protein
LGLVVDEQNFLILPLLASEDVLVAIGESAEKIVSASAELQLEVVPKKSHLSLVLFFRNELHIPHLGFCFHLGA